MMEDCEELISFIKVWFIASLCICYCYLISIRISNGVSRLLAFLPVISFFFVLLLSLSSFHSVIVTFLYIVWLANFKLILLAFKRGPLASTPPLPFIIFIAVALFPINPKKSLQKFSNIPIPSHRPILLAFKAVIFAVFLGACWYKDNFHPKVTLYIYIFDLCLGIELVYAITAFFVKILIIGFHFEIEPQFNEPILATSLQDFWGHRWNLMASSILRASVYNPVQGLLKPKLGSFWSRIPAIFVTFLVSGLMHELLYLYLTRVWPTWEVTWLFVVHGVCTAAEVVVKKAVKGRFQLHRAASGSLTVGFLVVTWVWWLLPQPLRNGLDVKAIHEYSVFANVIMSK